MTDDQPQVRLRTFWRPHTWVFWAYLVLVAGGAALWPQVFRGGVPSGVWVSAILLALLLGVLLALLIRWLDLFRGNQPPLLAAAFLWGAVPASAFALQANMALLGEVERHLGGYRAWGDSLVAPVVEESFKAAGIVAVVLIGRRYVVRATQGAVIGACCGLGFQLVEDVNYVLNAGAPGQPGDAGVVMTILVRSVTALDSHWLYSAMIGLGVGYAVAHPARPVARRALVVAGLCVVAWWMHFLSDSPAPEGGAGLPLMLLKLMANLLLGFAVYVVAMRAEWHRFATVAAAEPADVIAPADIPAMRNHRTRRRARKRARTDSGRPVAELTRQLQHTQLQLVNDVMVDGAAPQRRAAVQRLRLKVLSTGPQPTPSRGSQTGG